MTSDWKPTGRTRFRSQHRFGGREELVYQIEERGLITTCIGGHIDSDWHDLWRDARTSDLNAIPEALVTKGAGHGE